MNFSEFFVNRPVFTTLFMGGILIFGVFSYQLLPISVLPNIDFPTIQVSVALPGANADTMASSVALPLEKQFSNVADIDSISSVNTSGSTQITLQFALSRNIDAAAQDVQAAISSSLKQLPQSLQTPPSYKKVNPADSPIFYLTLTSDTMPLSDVDYYAETILAERISMLSGVAQVQVFGSQKYAVRILLDPVALAAEGLGLNEVANAISSNNANNPTGSLYGKYTYSTIQAPGQLTSAQEYENLILMYKDKAPVFLKSIGRVVDNVADDKVASWYNNKRCIILAIQKQPNTNTIQVVDSIKTLLPSLKKQIPEGVNINILFDRSESIRRSVSDVKFSLILAFILVVLVIFVFLHSIRSTIIPVIALPTSLIGTFSVMYFLGYNIDNLSLMALTLAVGLVVDDAIVVLENIMRHIENKEDKYSAVLSGTSEVVFTVISMTLSLAAVFIPLLFMSGILGKLLHEFAMTITTAILISGVISLTITPMLCNLFLSAHHNDDIGKFKVTEQIFETIKNKYQSTLALALNYPKTVMMVFIITTLITAYLFQIIPKGFLPNEDTGQITCTTEANQSISFDAMILEQQQVADILTNYKYIEGFTSSVGASGKNQSLNQGSFFIKLKPLRERPGSDEIIKELKGKLAKLPGIKVYLQPVATITLGGQSSKSQYQYTLQSVDQAALFDFAIRLQEELKLVEGFTDVTSDLQISQPQVLIEIDRDKATLMGISVADIQNDLYSAYGNQQISTIYTTTGQYAVMMEVDAKYQTDSSLVSLLHIKSANGSLVPIESLAKITNIVGPLSISHFGQLPAVTISFNLKPNYSLSYAAPMLEGAAKKLNMPSTISGSFQGTAKAFLSSLSDVGVLILVAVIVIYIILGMLYESFLHPITILSSLPTAGFGALCTLMIFNKELDMYGFVGLIMLIGIVKKNAIMIIDFTLEYQRKDNVDPKVAVYQACLVRFRPIMMTSLAALMGALPIAMALGDSGPERSSLGLAVVGGLLTSQLLTLYITPVIFLYLESAKNWTKNWL